ncbi:uncharacterized protein LOC122066849 [Macadamia integrifolia]|uniref:uncharacterized protein LOC122066849 n=1 Tax=Macadamia integrifolia TaxID=60698 RepID=UPI001C4F1DF5|nr:uncharacterized protein LOC122066849 [Macadamia integrifolia]
MSSPALTSAHHFISLKLSSTNSLFWKAQTIPFLHGQNVYGYITGTIPRHLDPTAASDWDDQDAIIMSLLIVSLSEEALPLIVDNTTSQEKWNCLTSAFGSASNIRIMSLNLSFQDLSQHNDESMVASMQHAKTISGELSASGSPLRPNDLCLHIFRTLHKDLHEIVPTLLARSEPLTYFDLHGVLLSHKCMLKASQQKSALIDKVDSSDQPFANST